MTYESTGRNVREFLRGLLGNDSGSTAEPWPGTPLPPSPPSGGSGGYDPNRIINQVKLKDAIEPFHRIAAAGVGLQCNHAVQLIPGHLLVVYKERVYVLDPNKRRFTFAFHLLRTPRAEMRMIVPDSYGNIYCSMSGTLETVGPIDYASFGNWGAVLKVNLARGEISSVCEGQFIDPFGLQLLPGNKLLVADFGGWGGTGTIYLVDLATEQKEVLSTGGVFVDPESAFIDEGGVLWVANSMHRDYDGAIVKVENGRQTVVVPSRGYGSGILCSVHSSNREDRIVGYVIDWPHMAGSALFHVDKATGEIDYLRQASAEDPKIFGPHGSVVGDVLWVGDSYEGEIIAFDLDRKRIVDRIDASPIKGSVKGVYDSFDFIETVAVIPPQEKVGDAAWDSHARRR